MVKLPNIAEDPTLEAMKKICEDKSNAEPRRTYIGASGIGHECSRNIWYEYNGFPRKERKAKLIWAAEDGDLTEDLIAERLRAVPGIELHTKSPDDEQYGFDAGFFQGHYDGVIRGLLQAPKTWHIWENKACNEKKFNALLKLKRELEEKSVLQAWDPVFYAQAAIYMYMEELTRHYTTVAMPGGRDIASIRTNCNTKFAEALIRKAERIHKAKEAPERQWKKDYYQCKWCDFYEECHGK